MVMRWCSLQWWCGLALWVLWSELPLRGVAGATGIAVLCNE